MPAQNPNLGPYLARLRKREGLSQRQSAQKAEIWVTRWSQIEGGERPRAETLVKMARSVRATPEEVRELFRLAGYEDLFVAVSEVGSRLLSGALPSLEKLIEEDRDLDQTARTLLLANLEGQRRRLAAARQPEKDGRRT